MSIKINDEEQQYQCADIEQAYNGIIKYMHAHVPPFGTGKNGVDVIKELYHWLVGNGKWLVGSGKKDRGQIS